MHKILKPILVGVFALSLFAAGCSSAQVRVMPGENGVHKVVAKDVEKDDAEEAAADAAKEYCEDKKQEAIFVKEHSSYKGDMDESARKTVRKASTAAQVLGGVNSPVSGAGRAGHIMTNDRDYEAVVEFKCK